MNDNIIIKGMHNVENYLAAFAATKDDVKVETMKNVAETFGGVEHRCEFVREIDGVKYYFDPFTDNNNADLNETETSYDCFLKTDEEVGYRYIED